MADETTRKNVLCVMDRTGDTRTEWSAMIPEEVSAARGRFDEMRRKGYLAFRQDAGGRGEVLSDFDPLAARIVMTPPMVGG